MCCVGSVPDVPLLHEIQSQQPTVPLVISPDYSGVLLQALPALPSPSHLQGCWFCTVTPKLWRATQGRWRDDFQCPWTGTSKKYVCFVVKFWYGILEMIAWCTLSLTAANKLNGFQQFFSPEWDLLPVDLLPKCSVWRVCLCQCCHLSDFVAGFSSFSRLDNFFFFFAKSN